MARKITAPHSYDPGRGRPKEYLAYLNEREMAYLRSINGNNMERGPRGLPSFPPDDSLGSSSNNSKPSGGNKGPGGPSGPNSGPSGGGSLGGGGKGAGASSAPSRGPGGPSGPNSGPSKSTSPSSPSSPMGGQGASFSSPQRASSYNADRSVQQRAQVNDTRGAIRQSPSVRNDLASGGVRTLSVGPMGTPVNVGPRVAPSQNRTSVAGGWGVAGVGIAQRGVPNVVSPSTSGRPTGAEVRDMVAGYGRPSAKQFTDRVPQAKGPKSSGPLGAGYDERIAPSFSPSTSISSQFPSYNYSSPLTPGMTPEDMARRGAMMDKYEREIRDIMRGDPVSTGDPNKAGGIPTGGRSPAKTRSIGEGFSDQTYSGGAFNQENEIQRAAVDRAISAAIAARDLAPKPTASAPRDDSYGSFISSAAAATPGSVDLRGAGYGTFNVPKSAGIDSQLREIEQELNAPSIDSEKEKILKVEDYYPGRPTGAAETYTSPYDRPSQTYTSVAGGMGMSPFNQTPYAERLNPESTTLDFSGKFKSGVGREKNAADRDARYGGSWRSESDFPDGESPFGIDSSGEIVRDGEYGYPTKPDGSPITAEDIADMPPEIQREYFDKVRHARRQDTPYPLTADQKMKARVAGVVTSPLRRGPTGVLLKGLSYVPGPIGEGAGALSDPKSAVEDYERQNPLRKQQIAERAGRKRGIGGVGTSTTSPGGGSPDIGSGGKNEPPRFRPVEREAPKPPEKPKEGGPRPAIYYKWDLGIDIPSPADSDYTLYTKYLQEKAAAKAGFGR